MKWYRIVSEGDGQGGTCYRIQQRGWIRWSDVRYIADFNPHGPSLTKILRFDDLEEAVQWIENCGGRNEVVKRVIGTYGVYG